MISPLTVIDINHFILRKKLLFVTKYVHLPLIRPFVASYLLEKIYARVEGVVLVLIVTKFIPHIYEWYIWFMIDTILHIYSFITDLIL